MQTQWAWAVLFDFGVSLLIATVHGTRNLSYICSTVMSAEEGPEKQGMAKAHKLNSLL